MSFPNQLKNQARDLQAQRTGQDSLFEEPWPATRIDNEVLDELAQRIVGQPGTLI